MLGPNEYTEKQQRAALLRVEGLTQEAAYGQAYNCARLTPEKRRKKASQFFRQPKIQKLLARLQEESARRCNVTQDRITRELSAVAFAILPDLVEQGPDGMLRLKALDTLTEAQRRAVRKLKIKTRTVQGEHDSTTTQETEVELHGKLEALNMLGQTVGMFKTVVQHEIPALDYQPAAGLTAPQG